MTNLDGIPKATDMQAVFALTMQIENPFITTSEKGVNSTSRYDSIERAREVLPTIRNRLARDYLKGVLQDYHVIC